MIWPMDLKLTQQIQVDQVHIIIIYQTLLVLEHVIVCCCLCQSLVSCDHFGYTLVIFEMEKKYFWQLVLQFAKGEEIPLDGTQSAEVLLARDTRPTGEALLEAAKQVCLMCLVFFIFSILLLHGKYLLSLSFTSSFNEAATSSWHSSRLGMIIIFEPCFSGSFTNFIIASLLFPYMKG